MRHKILIADGDRQILTILSERLNTKNVQYEIFTAKNGLEAILALQKHRFSVVITEIKMPKVNGMVVLGYMAKNFPELPCIIMTDNSALLAKKRLIKEPLHYIDKPFKIQELAELITKILEEKKNLGAYFMAYPFPVFLNY
nr:hypothetical protein [uncultured bacterium]